MCFTKFRKKTAFHKHNTQQLLAIFDFQDLLDVSAENKTMQRVNVALEEKLTNEILSKRISENVELIELRRTMLECETELHELRSEYLTLRSKTEAELDEEQKRIGKFESRFCLHKHKR